MNLSVAKLQDFWRTGQFTASLVLTRLREDRLLQTAGSLTFTTALSIVPLLAVALAVFSAFPAFAKLQLALQDYLLESLIPDRMADQILRYLNNFASKARGLTAAGLAVVVFTAVALMLTIDRTFNTIWRVQRARPLAQRVLVYWAAITLGPLLLGAIFALTSLVVGASKGVFGAMPAPLQWLFEVLSILLTGAALAALYRLIPNAQVSWRDALTGGMVAAVLFEIAKRVFTGYVTAQPTYSSVYGAFAVFPLFLLWVFTSWLIVLAGAVITAYAPAIRARALPKSLAAGAGFMDAIGLLRTLHMAQINGQNLRTTDQLAYALKRDVAYVNELAHELADLAWIGEVDGEKGRAWALICDPASTSVQALAERFVFSHAYTGELPQARAVLGEGARAKLADWLTE
jgi:membrane protein